MATEEIKKIEEDCEENKEMKKKSFGKTGFIVIGALIAGVCAGALLNRRKAVDEGDEEETIIYDPNNCASLEEVDESNGN